MRHLLWYWLCRPEWLSVRLSDIIPRRPFVISAFRASLYSSHHDDRRVGGVLRNLYVLFTSMSEVLLCFPSREWVLASATATGSHRLAENAKSRETVRDVSILVSVKGCGVSFCLYVCLCVRVIFVFHKLCVCCSSFSRLYTTSFIDIERFPRKGRCGGCRRFFWKTRSDLWEI